MAEAMRRPDEAAVLAVLIDIWRDQLGDDRAIDIDTPLIPRWAWEELDFYEMSLEVEEAFGFSATWHEWQKFCDSGAEGIDRRHLKNYEIAELARKNLTFGRLVAFVTPRTTLATIEPQRLLGASCDTAGAFRTVLKYANSIQPLPPRIRPSTPVSKVLRRRVRRRLYRRCMLHGAARFPRLQPAPPPPAAESVGLSVGFLVACMAAVWVSAAGLAQYAIAAVWVCPVTLFVAAAYSAIRAPNAEEEAFRAARLETFGDFARALCHRSN